MRRKSPPVPNGISPKLASGAIGVPASSKNPFTTSFTVPSPPIAITRSAPACSAARASFVASPGPVVIASSNGNDRVMVSASSVQRLPRRPPCEFGFTITVVFGASTSAP